MISWQNEGGKVETVTGFIFLGSKITVDSDRSHEIKRHLLLGRKAVTRLHSMLKNRHKGLYIQSFSSSHVQMNVSVGPHVRLSAKELMLSNCGVEDLRVPWTAGRSHLSILKEINPEYLLKGLMLKLNFDTLGV